MGAPCGKDERPPYHPGLAAQPAPGFYYHGGPPLGPYDAVPGHVVPGHVVPGVSPPVSAPSRHPYTDSGPVTRSSASSAPPRRSTTSCHRGVECTDFSEEHRRRFSHPENILLACQYGSKCYQKNLAHLKHFVHPGDRHYRMGLVHFPTRKGVRVQKEFPTLRDLFNFCDPDESGNISKEEFQGAWDLLVDLPPEVFGMEGTSLKGSPEQAWETAAGDERSHLTFAQFAKWAAADMKIQLPVGVDPSDTAADRPCRFQYKDRCPCVNFKATAANPTMCECGHKSSAHLSDVALMTQEEQEVLNKLKRRALGRGASKTSLFAPARKPGVTFVTDPEVLAALQELLSQTHKDHDNWTRDRGCALHGRHRCEASCLFRHRAPVPTGYKLIRAERNRNPALYHTYATTRGAIKQETVIGSLPFATVSPKSACDIPHEESLDPQVNEWRLLHGTSLQACKGICASNFRLKMAGSGATWKEPGMGTGRPLYGYGVYCAESSTKADEYAEEIRGELPSDEGCHAMLVCRVVGGLCRIVDTNEFDPDDLRQDVLDGPYHSVLGDRVVKLKKPFREIVVHDNNQIFPEFILYYKRLGIPE